jgi:mRNA-degrading endonuclease RelE of RelBE toxin-antitoxin system
MASLWNVQVLPGARRQLRKLDEDARLDADQAIAELTEEPFPFDSVPMQGYSSLYRVKFHGGRYRVVYQVKPKTRRIFITRVGPRDSVYEGLRKPGLKP